MAQASFEPGTSRSRVLLCRCATLAGLTRRTGFIVNLDLWIIGCAFRRTGRGVPSIRQNRDSCEQCTFPMSNLGINHCIKKYNKLVVTTPVQNSSQFLNYAQNYEEFQKRGVYSTKNHLNATLYQNFFLHTIRFMLFPDTLCVI